MVIFCFSGCWFSGLQTFQMPQILKKRCKFTLRWLIDLGSTSLVQNVKLKTLGYLLFILLFFICCLTAPWLIFGYYWGSSITHLMLITAFVYQFLVHRWLGEVGSLHLIECPVGFDHKDITHLATHSKLQKILSPDLYPDFPKFGDAPNNQNSYSLTLWQPLGLYNTLLATKFGV